MQESLIFLVMKNRLKIIITFSLFIPALTGWAQKENASIREGNRHYQEGSFDRASDEYREAITKNPAGLKAPFNLGDAIYRQEKYEDAVAQFESLAKNANDPEIKSRSFHNLGNSYLQQSKYKESIEAYKSALRIDPNMENTRYNLLYAMKKLQEQEQQQQQNQEQNQEQQENEQEQEQQQNQEQNQQEQPQQPQPQEMTREEAERMLEAMENKEKEIQENREKQKIGNPVRIEKDW